jgi:CheY-like chemotaxis protein
MSRSPDSLHVLCVDDEAPLLELTRRLLTRLGCRVTTHANPTEALLDFRARPDVFDLLITDVAMPGMSGFSLVTEVRKQRSDLLAVLSTGCVSTQDVELAERLGNTRIIQKSSSMDEYARLLQPLIHRSQR